MEMSEKEMDEQIEIEESLSEDKKVKSRLFSAKVISDRWEIEEIDNKDYHTYIVKDTKNHYSYKFSHIIGFEQVTEDEFLVYKRTGWDDFKLLRYKLKDNEFTLIFDDLVDYFYVLPNNNLLITRHDNLGSEYIKGVYSIDANDYVEEAKWLELVRIHMYRNDDKYVSLLTKHVDCDDDVVFDLDIETLQPKKVCYSTLRNSYINISSVEDLENVVTEDKKYSWMAFEQIHAIKMKQRENVAKTLIKKNDN